MSEYHRAAVDIATHWLTQSKWAPDLRAIPAGIRAKCDCFSALQLEFGGTLVDDFLYDVRLSDDVAQLSFGCGGADGVPERLVADALDVVAVVLGLLGTRVGYFAIGHCPSCLTGPGPSIEGEAGDGPYLLHEQWVADISYRCASCGAHWTETYSAEPVSVTIDREGTP